MCRIDYGDGQYLMYGQREVKVAKAHRCEECRRWIEIGEPAQLCTGFFDGLWHAHYICSHCAVAVAWLNHNCNGFIFSEVREEIEEHAEEYPRLALPMYRIAVGMRRKWERFDYDGLMPVPKMPPEINVR